MEKTQIIICQGSSCFSRGNKKNLQVIQQFIREQKLDAQVLFKGQLCSGNCKSSPVIIVNGTVYEEVDEEKTLQILNNHFLGK